MNLSPKLSIEQPLKKTHIITKHLKTLSKCQKMDTLYEQVIQRNFQIIDDLLRKLDLVFLKHEQFEIQLTNCSKRLVKMEADIDAIHNEHRRDNLHISSNIQNLKYELNGIDQHIKIIYDDYKKCGLTPTIKSCKNSDDANFISSHKCFSNLESCADLCQGQGQGQGEGQDQRQRSNLTQSKKSNVNFIDNVLGLYNQNQNEQKLGNESYLSSINKKNNNKYNRSSQQNNNNVNGLTQSSYNGIKRTKHSKLSNNNNNNNNNKNDDGDGNQYQQNQQNINNRHGNNRNNSSNKNNMHQMDRSGKFGRFKRKINGQKKNQLRKSLDDKIDNFGNVHASTNKKQHNNNGKSRCCGTTATIKFMDEHQNCTKSASNLLVDGYLRQDFIQPREKHKKITIMSDIRCNKNSQYLLNNNNNDTASNHNSSNSVYVQQLIQHQEFKKRFDLYEQSFKQIARKLDINTLNIKQNAMRIEQLMHRCRSFVLNDKFLQETFKLSKDIKKLHQQSNLSYANKSQTRKALMFLQSKLKSLKISNLLTPDAHASSSVSTCNTNASQHNNNQQQYCSIVSKCLSCNRSGNVVQEAYSRFGWVNNGTGGSVGNSGSQEKRLRVKELNKKAMEIIKSGRK